MSNKNEFKIITINSLIKLQQWRAPDPHHQMAHPADELEVLGLNGHFFFLQL